MKNHPYPSRKWQLLAKPGMNFAFPQKSVFSKLISLHSDFLVFFIFSFSMQNDYFLFTRFRATQITSFLAPCHSRVLANWYWAFNIGHLVLFSFPLLKAMLLPTKSEQLSSVKRILREMPALNRLNMRHLIVFLNDVANLEFRNKMNAKALGICIGSNLLRMPRVSSIQ